MHGRHHQYPNEYTRVALPLLHQYILVMIMTSFYYVIMFPLPFSSWRLTFLLGSGMMSGYSLYEVRLGRTCSFLGMEDVARHSPVLCLHGGGGVGGRWRTCTHMGTRWWRG